MIEQHCKAMISEIVVAVMISANAIIASTLTVLAPPGQYEIIKWTGFTILGALLASGGAFCLNTKLEIRKIVIGRCIIATVLGVIAPRIAIYLNESIMNLLVDPLLITGAGFISGTAGYIISYPFAKKLYDKAPEIADKQLTRIENKLGINTTKNEPDNKGN